MLSQHRVVFHGEYEYQLYLAERVIRQHSPNFRLQAPIDPPQFMRRPERMEAETITLLHAGVYFEHFLRGPEIAYKHYIDRHLMPGSPPVSVEVMRAMAVPGGYAPPPTAQPDMPPLPQHVASPEHDATPDDDL